MANDSRLPDPLAVAKDVGEGIGIASVDFRYDLGGLTQPYEGGAYGFSSGVMPGGSPGAAIVDLSVTANSTPNLTTILAPGHYVISRANNGVFVGSVTGAVTLTHNTADPIHSRIDYVIIRVREPGLDPPDVVKTADVVVLPGAAVASPTPPTGSLTDGDMVLAAVTVRAASTAILGTDIADLRVHVTARGGIYPKSATDTRRGSYRGQYRDNADTTGLERWDGTTWHQVANPSPWTAYTPTLYYTGGLYPPGVAAPVGLGSGGTSVGRYMLLGKTLYLNLSWTWAGPPYDGGWGVIFAYLPNGYYSESSCETHLPVRLQTGNGDMWGGNGRILFNDNIITFVMPLSASDCRQGYYQTSSTSARTPGTGIPYEAGGFPQGGTLTLAGALEIA